jgi:hypothetical protein
MIIHCDRGITHPGDLDISFVLLKISSKFLLHLECYLILPKRHIKIKLAGFFVAKVSVFPSFLDIFFKSFTNIQKCPLQFIFSPYFVVSKVRKDNHTCVAGLTSYW